MAADKRGVPDPEQPAKPQTELERTAALASHVKTKLAQRALAGGELTPAEVDALLKLETRLTSAGAFERVRLMTQESRATSPQR
jgi:hypothetical protein